MNNQEVFSKPITPEHLTELEASPAMEQARRLLDRLRIPQPLKGYSYAALYLTISLDAFSPMRNLNKSAFRAVADYCGTREENVRRDISYAFRCAEQNSPEFLNELVPWGTFSCNHILYALLCSMKQNQQAPTFR